MLWCERNVLGGCQKSGALPKWVVAFGRWLKQMRKDEWESMTPVAGGKKLGALLASVLLTKMVRRLCSRYLFFLQRDIKGYQFINNNKSEITWNLSLNMLYPLSLITGCSPSASITACNLSGMLLIKPSSLSAGIASHIVDKTSCNTGILLILSYVSPSSVSISIHRASITFKSDDCAGHAIVSIPFKFLYITLAGNSLHKLCARCMPPWGRAYIRIQALWVGTSRRRPGDYSGLSKSSHFKIWLTDWNDDKS